MRVFQDFLRFDSRLVYYSGCDLALAAPSLVLQAIRAFHKQGRSIVLMAYD